MKKITYLVLFIFSMTSFAQTNRQIIKSYLENSSAQLKLTNSDISDWIIESEVQGSGTKITSCYIVQRYQGIEIYNAQSNASLKDGKMLRFENKFLPEIAKKTNATSPSLSVIQAISKAYLLLEIPNSNAFSISETINNRTFKLTDGLQEDLISAKLVYQIASSNALKLAWAFQFYSPDGKHLWDLRIDALNGTILEKNDLNLSCNFGQTNRKNLDYTKAFSFTKAAFQNKTVSPIQINAGSYRVIPYNYESPNHSPFQLITTEGNTLASPQGWHNSNALGGTTAALNFTYTRGNNVLAQEDANGDNGNGIRADGTAALNFDFPYVNGVSQTQQPTAYTAAATTNLFYMINTIHDIWYQYGFDEVGGNFQQNNYGRGGATSATGDYVLADAQDGYSQAVASLNNANFSTPNDGLRPRVQMFLWDTGAPPTNFITVNSPATIAGPRVATTNVFEGTDRIPVPAAPNGITSDLVLYNNNPSPPGFHSACQAATNAFELSGKIVLIKRGSCFFSNKVKNAQDAGATAVIVMDSIANNTTRLSMSSTGILGITIPAVFITKEIGDELLAEMANGPVNVKLESPSGLYLFADGDFDNGIIGHEVGHGISNRLIGGPANSSCMTNGEQMGEGWSDWFGLMLQIKPEDNGTEAKGIGTYAINEPITGGGIRAFPYSTDVSINPLTLVDSNDAEPHNRGETWTAVLWDLTWAYIHKYGFDPDIYNGTGGNNKVMRLVIDALKLQTCNTASFISARDNLFAADQATTEGQDYCMIAEVFQKRGMGLNASSGDANNATDQVEDFTAFPAGPNCTLAVDYFNNEDMIRVYPNPTHGMLNIRINQFVGDVSIEVVDVNGRVVFNQMDQNFNMEKPINLSSLQKGMYILKLKHSSINYTEKIIIK
ncbi:T9SS-dependent M36 family metallopeptidase [Flavobacterium sp.]|uniref:T9SS-dependent M36 family metallopeptidase n=1 Tax=Flavobacterium sp. TaxID=239 RepID=UPI00286B32D0|nr:T9SS-dependent M36 family metallopeptidase [Flavobacterium sp.]